MPVRCARNGLALSVSLPKTIKSMNKPLLPLIAVGLLALAQGSFAATEDFNVSLDSAQENNPLDTSSATGVGTLTFDTTLNTLTFNNNFQWSGLSADSTLSHIHGPALPSLSAGVLYNLTPTYTQVGPGIRQGTFSGTLSLVDGTGNFTIAQQVSQLENGQWYLNIHSTAFPGGEIRGQIVLVPEPSMLALLGLGAGGLVWGWRRRH